MMSKEDFAKALKDRGYKVLFERGCVYILVPKITKKVSADLRRIAKEIGYDMSFGWKEDRERAE